MDISRLSVLIQRAMLVAWATTFAASTMLEGALPAVVVAGVVPPLLISAYRTLTDVEDLCAPIVSHVIARWRPGSVLLWCDVASLALILLALIGSFLGLSPFAAVGLYLLLTSPIPTVVDVADEYFGAEIAQYDSESAFAFTTHLHSLSAFISSVLMIPLGSILVFANPLWLLAISALLISAAVAARLRGLRHEKELRKLAGPVTLEDEGEALSRGGIWGSAQHLLHMPVVSPLSVGLWSLGGAIASTYTLVYIGTHFGETAFIAALILSGLAATVGPQIGRSLRQRVRMDILLVVYTALMALLLIGMAIGSSSVIIFLACRTLYSLLSSAFISFVIGTRQVILRGELFQHATTLSQGISAAAGILGVWVALLLNAETAPFASLSCGAGCFGIIALYTLVMRTESQQA